MTAESPLNFLCDRINVDLWTDVQCMEVPGVEQTRVLGLLASFGAGGCVSITWGGREGGGCCTVLICRS